MIIQAIRSLLFQIYLVVVTAVLALIVTVFMVIPPLRTPVAQWCADTWTFTMQLGLRVLVGIRVNIEGLEHIPEKGMIIASKHQSDLDIIALYSLFNHPSFIAKDSLFRIPLFGQALKALEIISIDRSSGGAGMRAMISDARKQLARDRFIFIFPEGTRKAPLADLNYRFGVIKMYTDANVPILPIALNTGLYWGRNSFILWPGTAEIRILPPIETGLPSDEAMAELQARIESETTRLVVDAVDRGLTRPLDEDFRARVDVARQRLATE